MPLNDGEIEAAAERWLLKAGRPPNVSNRLVEGVTAGRGEAGHLIPASDSGDGPIEAVSDDSSCREAGHTTSSIAWLELYPNLSCSSKTGHTTPTICDCLDEAVPERQLHFNKGLRQKNADDGLVETTLQPIHVGGRQATKVRRWTG